MGAQDKGDKMRLLMIQLCLSSIIECCMERKLRGVGSVRYRIQPDLTNKVLNLFIYF